MKPRNILSGISAIGLVLLLSLSGCASAPSKMAARQGAASADVVRATLANGLRVVVVRDALAPVVTQQITYFVGSRDAPQGFPGMAHAQEHMMFRGSPGLSGDQLSAISAQLGGNMNAYTTEDSTSYYFTVPASDLDIALKMGALRMSGVDNTEADWQQERGAIEQEVARDNSDPLYVLEERAQAAVFTLSPYDHTALGTKESFDRTTAALLRDFHARWYAPNNALLVVTGDVDPTATMAKIVSLYGSIPRKDLPPRTPVKLGTTKPETLSSTTDQPYGMVAFVFRMPGYRSADYAAARLAARVLDARRGAITALAYEGKTLNSGFSYQALAEAGYAYAWAAFPVGGDPEKVAADLRGAVEQAKSGVPPELVQAERERALLASAREGDSVSGLARAWTNAIALQGLASPDQAAARLETVATDAVQRQIGTLLDFDHAITLVVTPSSSPAPGAKKGAGSASFGSPESFGATPQGPVKLPDWASAALARLPNPQPRFTPVDSTLPNGLRLIVQPIPGSRSVSLYGGIHSNEQLQAPQGQEGIQGLMNVLFEWGPADMTRDAYQAAMDGIGAEFSAGTDFSLSTLPGNFEAGVRLLADDLLNPAFPSSAFATQRDLRARDTAGQMTSPVYRFRRSLGEALAPPGDPSLRRATPESIRGITLENMREYYRQVVRPDETTIVVLGAVDPAAVRAIVTRYFGAWKAAGPKPELRYAAVPPSQPKDLFVDDPVRIQNQVVMAETLNLNYDDPAHYAIALGNEYLGGSSFSSPLYHELRVQRGLVYSVGSSASFSKTRGNFLIEFGAYPEKTAQAKQLAVEVLKRMAATPLSAEELHLVKASQLRQIELSNESVGDVARSWIGYSEEGLSLDRLYQVAAAYRALDAAGIQQAFRTYVDPERLSTLVLGRPVPPFKSP